MISRNLTKCLLFFLRSIHPFGRCCSDWFPLVKKESAITSSYELFNLTARFPWLTHSLSLSLSLSLSRCQSLWPTVPDTSRLHLVSEQSWCKKVFGGRLTRAWRHAGVYKRTSLLLQQFCSFYLDNLSGKSPHSCGFVGCCFQDLSKTVGCILA